MTAPSTPVSGPGVCAACNSTNVTIGGSYGPRGRLGDPGSIGRTSCLDCGTVRTYPTGLTPEVRS